MDLGDLREFVEPPSLKFKIGGRRYEVAPASAEIWLKLQDIQARAGGIDVQSVAQVTVNELARMVLGPVYDKLLTDKVSGGDMDRAMKTAYLWQLGQDEMAALAWTDGGKAPRPSKKTSTSTGAATTTRRRASTSGTSTRKR